MSRPGYLSPTTGRVQSLSHVRSSASTSGVVSRARLCLPGPRIRLPLDGADADRRQDALPALKFVGTILEHVLLIDLVEKLDFLRRA